LVGRSVSQSLSHSVIHLLRMTSTIRW